MESMQNTYNTPKNSIPTALQTLLVDLNFLSQIERKMKPCFNSRIIVDDSLTSRVHRTILGWFQGEGRLNGIMKVEQIVNNSIEAIENQRYKEHLSLTINALLSARNGIDNLSYTYADDPDMKSRFNVLLQNVDIQLNRYRHLLKGYTPEIPSSGVAASNTISNVTSNEKEESHEICNGDFSVDFSKLEVSERRNEGRQYMTQGTKQEEPIDLLDENREKIKRNPTRNKITGVNKEKGN